MYVADMTLDEAIGYRRWREDDLLTNPDSEQIRWDIEDLTEHIDHLTYTEHFTPNLI